MCCVKKGENPCQGYGYHDPTGPVPVPVQYPRSTRVHRDHPLGAVRHTGLCNGTLASVSTISLGIICFCAPCTTCLYGIIQRSAGIRVDDVVRDNLCLRPLHYLCIKLKCY